MSNKSKFMPDDEELKKQQTELLIEMNKLDNEMRKSRKRKFIIILSIILIIVVVIKVFFGTIELYNIFGAIPSKARYYKITVNDKQVAASYTSIHKIPIIPFLVNFNSVYLGNSYIEGNDTGSHFYSDGSDKYIIDISSYNCYYNDIQTECKNDQQKMKRNNDEKYPSLIITRITNPHEVVYEGKYVDDIAPYITTRGQYNIKIIAKYGLTTDEVYFSFENH